MISRDARVLIVMIIFLFIYTRTKLAQNCRFRSTRSGIIVASIYLLFRYIVIHIHEIK